MVRRRCFLDDGFGKLACILGIAVDTRKLLNEAKMLKNGCDLMA